MAKETSIMNTNSKLDNFTQALRSAGFHAVEKVTLIGAYSPNEFVQTEVNEQAYQNAKAAGVRLHQSSNHYQHNEWVFVVTA